MCLQHWAGCGGAAWRAKSEFLVVLSFHFEEGILGMVIKVIVTHEISS